MHSSRILVRATRCFVKIETLLLLKVHISLNCCNVLSTFKMRGTKNWVHKCDPRMLDCMCVYFSPACVPSTQGRSGGRFRALCRLHNVLKKITGCSKSYAFIDPATMSRYLMGPIWQILCSLLFCRAHPNTVLFNNSMCRHQLNTSPSALRFIFAKALGLQVLLFPSMPLHTHADPAVTRSWSWYVSCIHTRQLLHVCMSAFRACNLHQWS